MLLRVASRNMCASAGGLIVAPANVLIFWYDSLGRKRPKPTVQVLNVSHTQFFHTKCHMPPWRSHGVPRPRLLERLQTGLLTGHKLTLLSAPAGYGKTTLVTGWLQSVALPAAWFSLDDHDNDLSRFLMYLLLALQQVQDEAGQHGQAALNAPQLPPLEEIAAVLLHDLSAAGQHALEHGNDRFLLVLDDYHTITQPAIHDLLNLLLEHLPPACHLIVISREDPPLPLPRLRARGDMTEIRAQDLRFTVAEATHFFNQAMQLNLSPELVAALETRTEGWIASLHLAALSLHGRSAAQTEAFIHAFGGSHRYVFDYLAEEVLAQQAAEVQAFLQQTAMLDRFHAPLCEAVTGRTDSQAMLQRLEQANLFLIPLDDERIWYRYHHLFAEYLRTLLSRPEQIALYKKAAAWLDKNDLTVEAVQYALASGDTDFAANVIEQALKKDITWSGGNVALLSSWLDALPTHALHSRPQLSLNAAHILYLLGRFEHAEKHITQTEQILRSRPATPETEHMLALAALYRGSIASVRGDAQQAIEQTAYAQAHLPHEEHLLQARAAFNLGLAYELASQTEHAVQQYLQSSDAAQVAGVLSLAIHARCAAAQVQIIQGRLYLAEQTCHTAIQLADETCTAPPGLAWVILGGIALERNDLATAERRIQEGIALARQGGLLDDVVVGLAFLARLYAVQGNIPAALAAMQEATSTIQAYGVPRMSMRATAHLARLQLYTGQHEAAVQWAAAYQSSRTASPGEFEDLTLAHILLATGALEAIPPILLPLLEQATAAGRMQSCIDAMLLLGLCDHARQDASAGLDWLGKALRLAAPEGYARIFLDAGQPLLDLLPGVRHAAPEFVDSLLRMCQPESAAHSGPREQIPDALSEQELRVLHLIVAGKSNQEIAEELVITVGTAKWHVHNILQKLGVSNRSKAIARARELGIV